MTDAEISALKLERDGWKYLAQGRMLLMTAYRTGRQPSEKAFKLIDKARAILSAEALVEVPK